MQKLQRKPVHATDATEPACRLWGLAIIGSETLGLMVGSSPYDLGKRLELYFSRQSTEIRSITLSIEPDAL